MTARDGCTIRAGVPSVCDRVLELWAAAGAHPTPTDTVDSLVALIETDAQALLVADACGEVVGSLIAGWNGWRGSLYRLAVRPDYRRRGLATRLVREAEARLHARGAVRIDAVVDDDDAVATHFWNASGYSQQEHRSRFVRTLDLATVPLKQ